MSAGLVQGSKRPPWAAAFLLMVAYALSWTDRTLPAILIEPMKASLDASDVQLALLTGFAFALCHATLAVPFSWIADRWDRAKLIMIGIIVWSALTIACGFAPDFETLFVARMGVGLGEAVLLPAAYSLISDRFSREDRPRALMIFVLGMSIGSATAFLGGAALHDYFRDSAPAWIGGLDPWRAVFVCVGAAGFAVAALMLLLPEPRRHGARSRAEGEKAEPAADTRAFLAFVGKAASFLVPLVVAVTLCNLFVNGYVGWLAPLFSRSYGWSLPQIGSAIGIASLAAGVAGAPLAAWAMGVIGKRRHRDAAVTVLVLAVAGMLPFAALSPLAPAGGLAFAGIFVALTLTSFAAVAAPAAIVNSAPVSMRARVSAVYLLIANLVGSGFGMTVFALATDHVFRDPGKLYLSLASVSALLLGVAFCCLVLADRRYERVMRMSGEAIDSTKAQPARR
ncbi:MFS transporter [Sphingosinicella rhizophila]|uniref:MFS transporter n=1 Tax=Sphingosinicella rhizophila TaxID=3050082 RepID=A0ABU3QAZ2_9SPHN|nr:MFS transporter [Sphingosinicella sp. GR2756]MDT9600492.1 MFS transporter [Sphingosinicella sp. GR2756]